MRFNILFVVFFFSFSIKSQTTQLKAAFCPATLSSLGTNMTCNGVEGAEGYRFEIWNQAQDDSIKTYDSYANNRGNKLRFSWVGGGVIEYSTTYAIRVSWYDLETDVWSVPGTFCEVTTPSNPITQIAPAFCGAEMASDNSNILCNQVTGAIQYRFEISIDGVFLENVDKTTYKLRLSDFTIPGHPQHCTQYDIRVAYRTTSAAAWSQFGTSCFVTFKVPTTVISPVYCGSTINYLQQDTINANALGVADGYRFRIESGITIIEDTVATPSAYNGITFVKFPGVEYDQNYNVSVKIRSNGCWGNYGPSCAIRTEFPFIKQETLGRTVIASAGGTLMSDYGLNDYILTNTLGETKTNTEKIFVFPQNTFILNEGFQQPDQWIVESTQNQKLNTALNIEVYPNPFSGNIIIDSESSKEEQIDLNIYAADGRFIKTYSVQNSIQELNLNYLTSGKYVFEFTNQKTNTKLNKTLIKSY